MATDFKLYFRSMQMKTALIAIPVSFIILPRLNKIELGKFSTYLIGLSFISFIYVGINYLMEIDAIHRGILQGHSIPIPFKDHIRFSIFLNFCFILSIYLGDQAIKNNHSQKKIYSCRIAPIYLALFIIFLAVKTGILILIFSILIYGIYQLYLTRNYAKSIFYFCFIGLILGLAIAFIPTANLKLSYFRWDIIQFQLNQHQYYSDSERILSIQHGYELAKKIGLWGVGEGNITNYLEPIFNGNIKLPHNQFIVTWIQNGIMGLSILISIFAIGIMQGVKNRNIYFIIYLLAMLVALCIEPMLETQLGITIFILPLLILYSITHEAKN